MEPDIFAIWRKSPFFIEVQNSIYSKAVMQAKIKRYELYFHSMEWQKNHGSQNIRMYSLLCYFLLIPSIQSPAQISVYFKLPLFSTF